MAISRGMMRERIRVVRKTRTARSDGGYDVSDTTVQERWAHIAPSGSSEREEAGRQHSGVSYTVTMDSRGADVTADDKLLWLTNSNLVLNVRGVHKPPRRDLPLELRCEAGVVT